MQSLPTKNDPQRASGQPRFLVLGALLLTSACGGQQSPDASSAPSGSSSFQHILLISMDTVRADRLGCYGAARTQTPAIDMIAKDGIRFDQAMAPAPTTLSSHTSMMTGTYGQTHGVVRNGFTVQDQNVMLAEILGPAGFHTAAFLGSFALESRFGFDQGFMHFDQEFSMLLGQGGLDQNQRRAEAVTDATLDYAQRVKDKDHLFLFAHYFDAHAPYDPPAPYDELYSPPGQKAVWSQAKLNASFTGHSERVTGRAITAQHSVNRGLTPELVHGVDGKPGPHDKELVDLYDGCLSYLDAQLGRLFDGLEALGILEDTLIIITGDHGETFYEHGDFWNHGQWTYQTTVHVPLIMRFPDKRGAGLVVPQNVSTIDIVPTLCELLSLEAPALVEGMSLLPAIDEQPFQRGPIFSQATQPAPTYEPRDPTKTWGNIQKTRCVRSGRWKYVRSPYLHIEQLFDLKSDPEERNDLLRAAKLAPPIVARVKALRQTMDAWILQAPVIPSTFDRAQLEDTKKRLAEIGYAGDEPDEESAEESTGEEDKDR